MFKTKHLAYIVASILILSACGCSSSPSDSNWKVKLPPKDSTAINPYFWVSSVHVSLGVPFDSDTSDDFIIIRNQYVLSYNKNNGEPNWVSWEMNADWFGDVPRYDGTFLTDYALPADFYHVKHSDYTNSGYDRGHIVRSEERTKTVEDNKSTFLLTNIIPQCPDLNQGVWLNFEYYLEYLCKKSNKELFVISGPIIHDTVTLKAEGKVVIPDSCFKIVVVLNRGQSLLDVTSSSQVIAVVMPNIDGIRSDKWEKYKTTVRRIEYSTGYDFLNLLSKSIQDIIETK